jgi:aspartate dehydrogenase
MAILKLGLIGNGAIARQIKKYCSAHTERFKIVGVMSRSGNAGPAGDCPTVQDLEDLLGLSPALIIECAGHAAVSQYGARVLINGTDLALVSVGSLCDENLLAQLRCAEVAGKARLIIVSGALPGMETLSTAGLGGLENVELQSSKPPAAWRGTLAEANYDLDKIVTKTIIFEGNARDAARLYPKNANVAAPAALAGIGFERTRIVLIADPLTSLNTHLLKADGAFGALCTKIAAIPSPDNPKTSLMAALSILNVLELQAASKSREMDNQFRCQKSKSPPQRIDKRNKKPLTGAFTTKC